MANTNQQNQQQKGFIKRILDPNDPWWALFGAGAAYFGQRFLHPANAKAPEINYSGAEDERLFEQLMACLPLLGENVLNSGLSGQKIAMIWRGLHQCCIERDIYFSENFRQFLLGKKIEKMEELISAMAQVADAADDPKKASADDPRKGRVMRLCISIAQETDALITQNGGNKSAAYAAEVEDLLRRGALILPKHLQAAAWIKKIFGNSSEGIIVPVDFQKQRLIDAKKVERIKARNELKFYQNWQFWVGIIGVIIFLLAFSTADITPPALQKSKPTQKIGD